MKISVSFLALAVGLVLASGTCRATTWVGDTLNVQVLSPNPQTVAFNGNFTAPVSNIAIFPNISSLLVLNIDATSVSFQNQGSSTGFKLLNPTTIKISDLTSSIIENAQLGPSGFLPVPNSLIFGFNFLQFDLQGVVIPPLSSLNVNVTFSGLGSPAPIPGPAALPVFASGLLIFAAVRWTKNGRGRRLAGAAL